MNTITSYFGFRKQPTAGGSIYHSGLDIAANEGTPILSCISGCVTYTGFNGSGGYTVIIQNNNFSSMYCHVSPTFLVYVGQKVSARRSCCYSWS